MAAEGNLIFVEGDEDIAGLISVVLKSEEFEVRSGRTASAALHQLRGLDPVFISLDLDLEGFGSPKAFGNSATPHG